MSTPLSHDAARSLPSTAVPDRHPDVVDLKAERQARRPGPAAGWFCPVCELASGGVFTGTEAAYLARVHDGLRHGANPTARIQVTPRGTSATTEEAGAEPATGAGTAATLPAAEAPEPVTASVTA